MPDSPATPAGLAARPGPPALGVAGLAAGSGGAGGGTLQPPYAGREALARGRPAYGLAPPASRQGRGRAPQAGLLAREASSCCLWGPGTQRACWVRLAYQASPGPRLA